MSSETMAIPRLESNLKAVKERPDPGCSDHAIDCLRYAAMFMWNRDFGVEDDEADYPSETFGGLLGHSKDGVPLDVVRSR